LKLLEARLASLPDPARPQAEAVLAARKTILDRLLNVTRVVDPGVRIRVHGDYHLGQVLRTEEDFVIIDFEGEPARSLESRRAKQSPLKDVAGMVRSFNYAAYAALLSFAVQAPNEISALDSWADAWQHWVTDAFLNAYRGTIGDAPLLPRGSSFEDMLNVFILDKAVYELGYELNNRPEWVRIPLTGILKVV
jgi:maltose alpha-D-glucosyltransferase/alpha-amylase